MPTTALTKRRAISSRLVLNVMAEITAARNQPASYEDSMIRLAVVAGQLEGRHLTPAKVAQYLDLPRTTVTRRVAKMLELGELVQDASKRTLRVPEEFLNSAEATAACRRISLMINNAAMALSKLDTKVIAEWEGKRQPSGQEPARGDH